MTVTRRKFFELGIAAAVTARSRAARADQPAILTRAIPSTGEEAGKLSYVGVTTSSDGQYDQLLEVMRKEQLDFIQVDYSISDRNAAHKILPLAASRGTAVLVNLPLGRGNVLAKVKDKPLPDWAKELDAKSFPQVFLKYVVSHPAVTVAIPGTTKIQHLEDNLEAARGRLPDAEMRCRIEKFFDAL